MGRNVEVPVCPECIQKCHFLHGKEKSSSLLPTSFFKIMLGHDFSKHMYIPPLFGRTVSALDGKKIILMDSRGRQWEVTVSVVNGALAFEEGWNVFSSDHGLKIGYILIFNYVKKLHFDVLIYDESGCEKLDFSKKRNQKKRCRDKSGSSVKDGLLVRQVSKGSVASMSDVPKIKRQHRDVDLGGTKNNRDFFSNYDSIKGKAQSVFITEHFEDPCLTSRDSGDTKRDDKASMFDMLDCEILNNSGGNGAGKVRECQFAEGLESEQVEISHDTHSSHIGGFCNTNQIFNAIPNIGDPIKIGEMLEMAEIKHVDMTPNVCSFEDRFHATGQMSKLIKKDNEEQMSPNVYKDELPATGEMSKIIKSELQDMTPNLYKDELLLAIGLSKDIKREPGQSFQHFNEDNESHSQTATTVSCVVPTDNDNFLELPAPLPLSNKRGEKMERMEVYLRGRQMRLWRVQYHEQSSFYALTEGWSEYRRANNIQPKDVCIFGAENKLNRIIAVNIVHN